MLLLFLLFDFFFFKKNESNLKTGTWDQARNLRCQFIFVLKKKKEAKKISAYENEKVNVAHDKWVFLG